MPSRGCATCRDKRVDWQESACPSVLLQLHTPQRGSCACSSCSCNSHKHQRRHILLLRDPGIPAYRLPELEAVTNDSIGLSKPWAQPLTLVSSGMRGTASPVKAPSKTSACLPRHSRTAWPSCLRAAPMAPSECAICAAQTQQLMPDACSSSPKSHDLGFSDAGDPSTVSSAVMGPEQPQCSGLPEVTAVQRASQEIGACHRGLGTWFAWRSLGGHA